MVRLKLRQDFERNRHVDNLDVINMLLHKNQQEYQETMNCWKQEVSSSVNLVPKCQKSRLRVSKLSKLSTIYHWTLTNGSAIRPIDQVQHWRMIGCMTS